MCYFDQGFLATARKLEIPYVRITGRVESWWVVKF